MSIEIWTIYLVSIVVVILIPGPLSLFMVSNSLNHGIVKSYPGFLGGVLASSMYLVLSATGVGALIAASENLFLIIKLMGAAYLLYLGFSTIRQAISNSKTAEVFEQTNVYPRFTSMFKKAFLLGASNPKDIIFFMAFLPQFITKDEPLVNQITMIVLTWVAVDLSCKILYGFLAKTLKPFLNTAKSKAIFDKSTGALYLTAGVAALLFV